MSRVPWINHKPCDWNDVSARLNDSFASNQLTNYGPVVRELESYFTHVLNISSDKVVIAVVNGAVGMNALVAGIDWTRGKQHRYATQAFTFPCAAQGPLQHSLIVDIDQEYGPDLQQVPDEIDGLIVTNLFGHVGHLDKYLDWAEQKQKILLFDNATVPLTTYRGRSALDYGVGSIISLHHTKPIGFGEGGLIVVDRRYETNVRKCINFGFETNNGVVSWHPQGMNGKMSEIAAATILSHLKLHLESIQRHQIDMYQLFQEKLRAVPGVRLFPNRGDVPFVSCLALICDRRVGELELQVFERHHITAKKYYTPLRNLPQSTQLFDRILCLPCHLGVDEQVLDRYIEILQTTLKMTEAQ